MCRLPVSQCVHTQKQAERTLNLLSYRPHPSLRVNISCLNSLSYVLECRIYQTIKTGMTKNSPCCLLRLCWLFGRPLEYMVLCISCISIATLVYAHDFMDQTNLKRSKLVAQHIYYALWASQTIYNVRFFDRL